ncbi:hypothetical protein MGN70_014507 [Eutypa lata]|nr:hypothetical protein MGN70_014507 [Eutypa lata]
MRYRGVANGAPRVHPSVLGELLCGICAGSLGQQYRGLASPSGDDHGDLDLVRDGYVEERGLEHMGPLFPWECSCASLGEVEGLLELFMETGRG